MKKYLIIVSFLFASSVSFCQMFFEGVVLDKITNEPIDLANIQLQNDQNYQTNSIGIFKFLHETKAIEITVTHVGYLPLNVKVIKGFKNFIYLQKGFVNLNDIAIVKTEINSYKTINKLDLSLRPVKSAQDLLKIVPGLFIAQHAGGGKAEQIFLRGFDIDHGTDIKIAVDGLPVNMVSHAHGQGYADLHFVIPELVKKIDYGKGPYYAEQGNMATAGYVNFQTTKKLEQSSVSIETGQFNTLRTLAMIDLLQKNKENQNAYIAGEYLYSNGPFISKQNFNRINLVAKYNKNINTNNSLHFMSTYFYSKWNASGQVPLRAIENGSISRFGAIDDKEGGKTSRINNSISLLSKFKNATIEQQAYFTNYKFKLFSNFTFFLNDSINGDQIKQAETRSIFGYNSKMNFNILPNNNSSTIGIGFRADKTMDSELSRTKNKTTTLERLSFGNIKEQNIFLYADQKINFNKLTINIGSRLDYFSFSYFDKINTVQLPSQRKAIISPKINFNYTVNNKLQLYYKVGRGFHSNDTRVVVPNNGNQILPSAYGTDIGFIAKPTKNIYFNVSTWYLYLQNEFVYVGDEAVVEASGKTRRFGIDFLTHYQLNKQLVFDASVNIANPKSIENRKGENYIPLAPTLTSTGGVTYKNRNGINSSLRYRYIKNRPANETNTVIAKGYTVIDANINYIKKKYEIGLSVENLLNTTWNEAQFNTTSKLSNEITPVEELHITPGVPFFAKIKLSIFF